MNKLKDSSTILVVEKDETTYEAISILLQGEGYEITRACNRKEVLEKANDLIDLIILDDCKIENSVASMCRQIREMTVAPLIIVSDKTQDADIAIGLMAGADDYIIKPISYAELLTRVKAHLRRYIIYRGKRQSMLLDENQTLTVGRLRLSLDRNEVWKDEKEINLTETEYRILKLLISHPQNIFSSNSIYETIWDEPFDYAAGATVMVHIRRLRTKIEDDLDKPVFVVNVWGKGYRLGNSN